MNLRVCNSCGKNVTDKQRYHLDVEYYEKSGPANQVTYIDLCPQCYDKLLLNIDKFKYGESKIAEEPSEGTLTQNFISLKEFYALHVLFEKYFRHKKKLRAIVNNFLYKIDSRITHEISESEMSEIANLAARWENEV